MYSKFLLLLAAFFAATFWFGCDDENPPLGNDIDPVGSIQIVTGLQHDTLSFVPGDFASVSPLDITIIVTDWRGMPDQNETVEVSLSDTSLGTLSYVFPSNGNTTDSLGRVYLYYHYRILQGTQLLTVSAIGVESIKVIQSVEVDPSTLSFHLEFNPDTVDFSNSEIDSTVLSLQVMSNGTIPVMNYDVIVSTTYTLGSYPPFLSIGPTDHNGYAETVVYITGGTMCCDMGGNSDSSTACVTVIGYP